MNLAIAKRSVCQLTMIALLAGCASPPMTLPGPISYTRTPAERGGTLVDPITSQAPTSTQVTKMPSAPISATTNAPQTRRATPADAASGEEMVSMALEQTPLPLFIQILYGNVLKQPYSMDTAINARTDLVTFKTSAPIRRSRLAELGVALLRSYGLSVQEYDGLVRIVPDNAPSAAPSPILRLGRTLPETPEALRTAFQYVELDIVRTTDIMQSLRQVLGTRITVLEDSGRNSLLLSGTQNDLRTALDLIRVLDQPRMRGNVARRINPAYMPAQEFASRLVEILTGQGYSVSTSATGGTPILLIPIPTIGAVMAFANSEQVMEQVVRWAAELDKPVAVRTQNGLYTYPVQFADAEALARTLGEIMGGLPAAPAVTPGAAPPAAAAPSSPRSSRVVVNSATNTLIFRGTTADEYQQIMALMRELDRPVKSALIEVVVAEMRLGGSQALGIEWNVPPQLINSGQNQITAGTQGRLGIGSSGFTVSIGNRAGTLLAQLNTLASNNQARILSNPKVLARNGETASIQVGSEVPVITSQQSGSTTGGLFGGTGVLQQISYRSTGVILRVRPVINSGNRLDLDVSQEVSSAAETRTGVAASPTISTRRIDTKLSLRDGSTVLLGGLISRNSSDANTGIPYLKDIPGLGALFRTESNSNDQTELLIMITPYVVSDDFESESITAAIQKSFGSWAQDLKPARVMEEPPARPLAPVPAPQPLSSAADRPVQPVVESSPPSAVPGPGAVAPQPEPARPTAAPDTDAGVTMSKPPAAAGPPGKDAAADKPAEKPAGPPSAAKPPASLPQGSRQVEDQKIKEEIEKLLKGK
ncbi:secretin N-terminal domain-containing protein [Piscinibacter sakaiensis]|uniref:secretin N-terminal domain-containing protein n=1 Tax=Piscinibacter sakaiensis TaxID=1547922 RepID=UPI003AACE36A